MKVKYFIADDQKDIIEKNSSAILNKFPDDTLHFAQNPHEALKNIIEIQPDIAIIDLNFEEASELGEDLSHAGIEIIAKNVKRSTPNIKIVVCSQYFSNSEFRKFVRDNEQYYDVWVEKDDTDDLLDKYEQIREEVLVFKTGLIPKLCKFFDPLNFNGDEDSTIHRLLHTDNPYKYEDNLRCLQKIINHYKIISPFLKNENNKMLEDLFAIYKERRWTSDEVNIIKNEFYFKFNNLKGLKGGKEEIYAEKSLINRIWDKIIGETEDHCRKNGCCYKICEKAEREKHSLKFTVVQDTPFDFDNFKDKKTLSLYREIKNYGDIFICSGIYRFDVLTNKKEEISITTNGTKIEMILKIIPTVKR